MRRVRSRAVGDGIDALPVEAILAVMPGFVALIDSEGTILDVGGGTGAPGRPDAALIGFRLHDFLPVAVADALVGAIARALANGQPVTVRYAVTDDKSDARYRTATINPTGDGRALMHVHDVTLDHHDRLTGLPDRSSLHAELDLAIVDGTAVNPAVLLVDIDRFKRLNDSLGYSRGDEAIVAVADRIAEVVGGSATIGHVGGDEFVVALNRVVDAAEALELATLTPRCTTRRNRVATARCCSTRACVASASTGSSSRPRCTPRSPKASCACTTSRSSTSRRGRRSASKRSCGGTVPDTGSCPRTPSCRSPSRPASSTSSARSCSVTPCTTPRCGTSTPASASP
jgi:diguanylate cyclase (GGDEF)-like protein